MMVRLVAYRPKPMPPANKPIGFFEIPVLDMARAIRFYETVFDCELERRRVADVETALFPKAPEGMGVRGGLMCQPELYRPSDAEILVYFSAVEGDLDQDMARVEKAGGKILVRDRPAHEGKGAVSEFLDTEGNRLAFVTKK